jgi:hypothetical protein
MLCLPHGFECVNLLRSRSCRETLNSRSSGNITYLPAILLASLFKAAATLPSLFILRLALPSEKTSQITWALSDITTI